MNARLPILLVLALAGCGRPVETTASPDAAPKAAEFKKGQGVLLSTEAAEFIGLRQAAVALKGDHTVVPRTALLETSEGWSVYVLNGTRWLRTPVKLVGTVAESTEVTNGLLEGDEVAVSGAQGLWLAELQAIKGGVGCADGH